MNCLKSTIVKRICKERAKLIGTYRQIPIKCYQEHARVLSEAEEPILSRLHVRKLMLLAIDQEFSAHCTVFMKSLHRIGAWDLYVGAAVFR